MNVRQACVIASGTLPDTRATQLRQGVPHMVCELFPHVPSMSGTKIVGKKCRSQLTGFPLGQLLHAIVSRIADAAITRHAITRHVAIDKNRFTGLA